MSESEAERLREPGGVRPPPVGRRTTLGLLKRLRAYFLAGVIIVAPISLTIYIVLAVIQFFDAAVTALIPARYNPNQFLPFNLPGLGLVLVLSGLTLIGMLTANFLGRAVMRLGESIVNRMPVVRNLYSTLKQIFETVFAQTSRSFREVVLVEYPRRGIWVIGFVTGRTTGEVQESRPEDLINVFLPTTPNPTSGFLLFIPREDLITLDMTIEQGIKMVISGGIVTPESFPARQPPRAPLRTPAEAD
jgi:uncharacterized membrane protein